MTTRAPIRAREVEALRRIVGGVVAALCIAVLALGVWFASVDTARLKAALAAELSEASGYPIAMRGDLELRLLPQPGLRIEDIRIESPLQGEGHPLAKAGRIEIGIDLLGSIQERVLMVGSLQLHDVEAWLYRDAKGQANWSPAAPATQPHETTPRGYPIDPTPQNFGLVNFELQFRDDVSKRAFTLSSVNADAQRAEKHAPVQLNIRGVADSEAFHLSGTFSQKAESSEAPGAAWPVDLSLTLGKAEARVGIRGTLGKLPDLSDLDLALTASCAEPAALATRLGGEQAGAWGRVIGPIAFKGRLRGDGKQGLNLQNGSLELGSAEHLRLALSGSVHDLAGAAGLEMKIELESPDLSQSLGPLNLDVDLAKLGHARLQAQLRGSASAPRAEEIEIHLSPQEGLEAKLQGNLNYAGEALQGQLDLAIQAKNVETLTELVESMAQGIGAEPQAMLAEIKKRPMPRHLLALRPLVLSARIQSAGDAWALERFDAKAGPVENDWIALSGRAHRVWPDPHGFEIKLRGELDQPGHVSGLAHQPVGQIDTLKLAGVFKQSAGAAGRIENIDLHVRALGGVELGLKGSLVISGASDEESGQLEINLQAPTLAAIGETWGASLPPWGPVLAKGRIEGSLETLRLRGLNSQIGKTHLEGSGMLSRAQAIPSFQLNLRLDELDLRQAPHNPGRKASAESQSTPPASSDSSSRLDAALQPENLSWLSDTEGSLALRIDRVRLDREWTATDGKVDLRWGKGVLNGPNLTLGWPGGALAARGEFDTTQPEPVVSLGLRGTGLHLDTLVARLGQADMASGLFGATIDLSTRGRNTEALEAHLSGGLLMDVGHGTLADRYADAIELSLKSRPRTGSIPMTCFIAALNVDKGIFRTDALLWDAPESQVRGAGMLNLPTRTADFVLRPHLKETIATAITTAVRVKGPMNSLSIRPEPFQTASDLARGLIGRALHVVSKVSPQIADAVIQLGTTTDKMLSSTGVDAPSVLSLLQDPVDCKTVEADPKVQALRAFAPGRPGKTRARSPAPDPKQSQGPAGPS